jgi:DNA polymerase III subunit gamma/tau
MAYLVMARKWRPRNFEEMVGQEHIARTLRNAIEGKRIAHAYLFTGTRGVGKTTSARILAKALNCEKGPTPTPCDVCDSCKAVSAGTSMDVLEIDGASNRGVGEIRELREQVKYAPMQGGYKVYIIDEVHMLTKEAFNALLKTLEEPPPHVVFLFATTEANKVPHTILSRVQRFDFKRISEAMIRGRLEYICQQESITFETEALEAIARKADGSMRDALSLFDQVIAFSGNRLTLDDARRILGLPPDELFSGLLDALVAHDASACYALVDRVMGEGIELGEFLLGFGTHLRDLLFARQEGISAAALGFSENRYLALRSTHVDLRDGDLIRYGRMVSDMLGGLKSVAHPRLQVEMGLLRMASLDRIATLSQLLSGQMAQGGMGGGEPTSQVRPSPAVSAQPVPTHSSPPPSPSPLSQSAPLQTEAAKKKSLAEPTQSFVADAQLADTQLPDVQPTGSEEGELSERDLVDGDPGYENDPELMPMPPSAMAEAAEALRFDSLASLAQNWSLVLQELLAEPTLMAIHLGRSRFVADVTSTEDAPTADTPTGSTEKAACRLEVAHQVAFDFFTGQAEARRKLQQLVQSKLRYPAEVAVTVAMAEGPAPEMPVTVTPGLRRRLADEPIVQSILQLFDGRVVAGGG